MDREPFMKRTDEVILDYVVDVINEHGEAAVRIADVARETGTSTSSIYHFFTSREELIAAAEIERYSRELAEFTNWTEPQFARVTTKEQFRDLVLGTHRAMYATRSAQQRMTRLSAVGSTLGRPLLMEKFAAIQETMVLRYAEVFRGPQERGWIRPDVNLGALSAWTFGHLLGRALIELGETSIVKEEWNRISEAVVLFAYFGETSDLSGPAAGSTSVELGFRPEDPSL